MAKRKLPSDEKLIKLSKNYRNKEIAGMYNVTCSAVCRKFQRLGIEKHNKYWSNTSEKEKFKKLLEILTDTEMAKLYDSYSQNIRYWRNKFEIDQ